LSGVTRRISVGELVRQAAAQCGHAWPSAASSGDGWAGRLSDFLAERMRYMVEQRGAKYDEVNAVVDPHVRLDSLVPSTVVARAKAIAEARHLPDFEAIAELFKRVKNISKNVALTIGWPALIDYAERQSEEAAEKALIHQVAKHAASIHDAEAHGDYLGALTRIAKFQPFVAQYFDEVLVMDPNETVRERRLQLMAGLKELVLTIADISEIAPKDATV
jgi:glycyl-tRNA synthetase beta chain